VVEDDYAISAILADELALRGHLVDAVLNGAEALESIEVRALPIRRRATSPFG
jgi:DNA-binding response OmpR family regulator